MYEHAINKRKPVGVDDHIDPQCTVMKYILGGYPYACKFER